MTEEDAPWLRAVRGAVDNERGAEPLSLDESERARIASTLARAVTKAPKARTFWMAGAGGGLALAASVALLIVNGARSPGLPVYSVELIGAAEERGAPSRDTASATASQAPLVVRPGAEFVIVLRPTQTSPAPTHVTVSGLVDGHLQPMVVDIEKATTGAVRIRGDGRAVASASELVIELTPGSGSIRVPLEHR